MQQREKQWMSGGRGVWLALGVATLGAAGCEEQTLRIEDELSTVEENLFYYSGDVVNEWNEHAIAAITTHNGYADPLFATRVLTMTHLAMHDAINATSYRWYRSYAYQERDRLAHPVAAAAAAAERVLVRLFPAQQADLQDKLNASLKAVRDGKPEQRGVALGGRVGDFYVELRANDGADVIDPYTPGDQPGDYQFTTPGFIAQPGWQRVTPWGLETGDQFRSAPPPAVSSAAYAKDYHEVHSKGDVDSTTRTPDESAYAQFWYEFSDSGWNRVTRVVNEQEHLGLASAARLFALVNMVLADAYIAGWDSKFFYDRWRPVTAIHQGDSDNNPQTVADASYTPFLPTPPVQDYPSTHSALGAAAAEVLSLAFGRRGDRIGFAMTSPTASQPNVEVRGFKSFRQAARENADSRVMAGIHFRFACEAGLTLGQQIGRYVFENHLTSVR